MKKFLLGTLLLLTILSCRTYPYYRENGLQTSGIDFSKGKWILGSIVVEPAFQDELTKLAFDDFTKHLDNRLINGLQDRSLLVATNIPLNPSKSNIRDLKKGTNCDFYINIKCESKRNDGNQFDVSEKTYYKKQLTFAKVSLEVYDLNTGTIVFSQAVSTAFDENIGLSSKPARKLILGCYRKIIDDINKKSI